MRTFFVRGDSGRVTTFVALGDSFTLGIGDPIRNEAGKRNWRGWAVLVAGTLQGVKFHNLAVNGALIGDVEKLQLSVALQLSPDIASVIVGINDVLRPNFDPTRIAASADHVVSALRDAGADVITMRLPDPGRMLGLPDPVGRLLALRVATVNEVMDDVARRHGTIHLDVSGHPELYDPQMWSADRLHPSERGHRHIARMYHTLLAERGYPLGDPPGAEPENDPPSRAERIAWMILMGSPWLIKRSGDLGPDLVREVYGDWLGERVRRAGRITADRGGPGAALRRSLTVGYVVAVGVGSSAYRHTVAAVRTFAPAMQSGSPAVSVPGSPAVTVPASPAVSVAGSPAVSVPGSPAVTVPGSRAVSVPGSRAVSVPGPSALPSVLRVGMRWWSSPAGRTQAGSGQRPRSSRQARSRPRTSSRAADR